MQNLAQFKRRCKDAIGQEIQLERHLYKPKTYKARMLEVNTVNFQFERSDGQTGYVEFRRAPEWEFSEDAATQYTQEKKRRKLLTITFL